MVLGGEGYIDIKALADLMADYTLLKAGDKLAGAKGQGVIHALTALKSNIADKAFVIDNGGIAHLGLSALGGFAHTGIAIGHGVQLGLYIGIGHFVALALGLQALVLAQGNLRLNSNLGDKGIMGAVNILQLHFWISDRLQAGLLEGLLIGFAVAGIDGILVEIALAYHLVNDALGSLALTETGDIELGSVLLERSIQRLSILLAIHGDIQFVQVGVHFLGFVQFHL